MNHRLNSNADSEKISRIETDVNLIKEMTLLANEKLFVAKLKEAIGKSKNKVKILLSCYKKPKNQTELCSELKISKGNLSLLIKDLSDYKMIYPIREGRSKVIQLTFKIRKHSFLELISEIFDEKFTNEMESEYLT